MKKDDMHFYVLLRDFLTDYLVNRRNFSSKTVRAYRQTMKLLRSYFKEEKKIRFDKMDYSFFSRSSVYGFLMWLKDVRGNTAQTLNLRLSAIKSFLKFCGEEDADLMPIYLDVSSIHAFNGTKKLCVEYLTQEQLKLLFTLPDIKTRIGRRNRFFLIFAYETGMRLQELLDLRLGSIVRNDANVRVRIHGKGNKTRFVPLLGNTIKHLGAYIAEFHAGSSNEAYLFFTTHDSLHTQMKPGTVDYIMKKYGEIARRKDLTFPEGFHAHMLRHSIAMAMYKKGIPISYIRDFLGHTSIETTAIYSYADEETIAKALESVAQDGHTTVVAPKNWKGKEQYLLEFCSLS